MVRTRKKTAARETIAMRSGPEILHDIDREVLTIDGEPMSKREAHLRLLYSRALNGNSRASVELQLVRDKCGVEKNSRKAGCLVVPESIPLDEWERLVAEQQRPFREGPYPGVEH